MKILRSAMQSLESEQTRVKMSGPLAQVYSEALNVLYHRREGGDINPVLESYDEDVLAIAAAAADEQIPTLPEIIEGVEVFALPRSEVTPERVVEITQELAQVEPEQFLLVTDACEPGANGQTGNIENTEAIAAIEPLVTHLGGRVVHSFPAMVRELCR